MTRKILFYLFLFLIYSLILNAEESQVSYTLEEYPEISGEEGIADFKGFIKSGETGQPGLPFETITLLLPPDADILTVVATLDNVFEAEVSGEWDVLPMMPLKGCEGEPVWPVGRTIVEGRDIDAYTSDQFSPAEYLGRVKTGKMREYQLVDIQIFPYKYNPAQKAFKKLENGEVRVSFQTSEGKKLERTTSFSLAEKTKNSLRPRVKNFEDISPLYEPEVTDTKDTPSRYVIITTEEILTESTEIYNFLVEKEQRDFDVDIITEQAWGGGIGDNAAESIRSWLQLHYLSMNIEYVLLVGNPRHYSTSDYTAGKLAMKQCYPWGDNPYADEVPTDFYFSELSGDWDLDDDGLFGEYVDDSGHGGWDRYYEIKVGRIPHYPEHYDISTLDSILRKIIDYPAMIPFEMRTNVLMAEYPLSSESPAYPALEYTRENILEEKGWGYHRVYNEVYDLDPAPETTPTTYDTVSEVWSSSEFGAFFWYTHGSSWHAKRIIDKDIAKEISTDVPVFTFQASCSNANPFMKDNLAYILLQNSAVSTVAGTTITSGSGAMEPQGTASGPGMLIEYARKIILDELTAGEALSDIKIDLDPSSRGPGFWQNFLAYNIYGDPQLGIFSTVCRDLDRDGYGNPVQPSCTFQELDCDDDNPYIFPDAPEGCDFIDTDCDGSMGFHEMDLDSDGFAECEGDCDDWSPILYPGAPEICDAVDNDCDGDIDEGFDKDGDGYATCGGDCDDTNPDVHPTAIEFCYNRIDDDCDGYIDFLDYDCAPFAPPGSYRMLHDVHLRFGQGYFHLRNPSVFMVREWK